MKTPTNIITGFLGSGKTTAILQLLKEKPADQHWAVLVNEFGEIGIDGAMMTDQGALIKEVPGGCMCCAAGVPMSVAITSLLRTNPDRLIVEPTGLGHAHKVLATLSSSQFEPYIELKATIGLVDPRNLSSSKHMDNQNFLDQLAISDIIIGNKVDQCHVSDIDKFNDWVTDQTPPKIFSQLVKHGSFPIELLDSQRRQPLPTSETSHHHQDAELEPQFQLSPDQVYIRKENSGQGYFSCGWIFGSEVIFNFDDLFSMLSDLTAERVKGVLNTNNGCFAFNVSHGVVSVNQMSLEGFESRLEVIDSQPLPWDQLEAVLKVIGGLDSH
ncbi:GTP-binding protein [Vibrio sp. JPW-9-11-11]|uniref:CobW family GTP-binding protein n=1 Tax=Vibrio sp. JPW-9-11-11 TaxID=1416532 RepID=UPI001592F5FD|nr:GTP-binding protein [Vibrio sp. JPW-9-11-11]NVD08034.1 GTP-binding protein [Vibrio sp. JPW-9-11-11]